MLYPIDYFEKVTSSNNLENASHLFFLVFVFYFFNPQRRICLERKREGEVGGEKGREGKTEREIGRKREKH